jgi:hypothetical protein
VAEGNRPRADGPPDARTEAKPARRERAEAVREPGEAHGARPKRAFGKPFARAEGQKGAHDAPRKSHEGPRKGKGAPAKGGWKKPEAARADASDTSRRFDPSGRPGAGPKGAHDAPRKAHDGPPKGKGAPAKGGWKKPEAARADASDTSRRYDPSERPRPGPKGGKGGDGGGGKGKPRGSHPPKGPRR